jgi:hypothetical protein
MVDESLLRRAVHAIKMPYVSCRTHSPDSHEGRERGLASCENRRHKLQGDRVDSDEGTGL